MYRQEHRMHKNYHYRCLSLWFWFSSLVGIYNTIISVATIVSSSCTMYNVETEVLILCYDTHHEMSGLGLK